MSVDSTTAAARIEALTAQLTRATENYDLCRDDSDWNGCTNYEREIDRINAELDELTAVSYGDSEEAEQDDAAYWAALHEREDGDEDRYLDSHWEDQNEYGMEGCCGDF